MTNLLVYLWRWDEQVYLAIRNFVRGLQLPKGTHLKYTTKLINDCIDIVEQCSQSTSQLCRDEPLPAWTLRRLWPWSADCTAAPAVETSAAFSALDSTLGEPSSASPPPGHRGLVAAESRSRVFGVVYKRVPVPPPVSRNSVRSTRTSRLQDLRQQSTHFGQLRVTIKGSFLVTMPQANSSHNSNLVRNYLEPATLWMDWLQ
ncbi:hypothetical protein FOCC_FOCC004366 [Frankliniella occidentalis]|nr:hypothetical protein FOCC_FOCC004366 [Frankliniella occidentalis]